MGPFSILEVWSRLLSTESVRWTSLYSKCEVWSRLLSTQSVKWTSLYSKCEMTGPVSLLEVIWIWLLPTRCVRAWDHSLNSKCEVDFSLLEVWSVKYEADFSLLEVWSTLLSTRSVKCEADFSLLKEWSGLLSTRSVKCEALLSTRSVKQTSIYSKCEVWGRLLSTRSVKYEADFSLLEVWSMKQTFLYSKYKVWISLRSKSKLEPFLNEVWSGFSLLEVWSGIFSTRKVKWTSLCPMCKKASSLLETVKWFSVYKKQEQNPLAARNERCLSALYYKKTFSLFEQQGAGWLHWSKSTISGSPIESVDQSEASSPPC